MGREGFIVPMETQASLKKKTAVSWRWMLMDDSGEGAVLDLDKYDIMRRVPIHARDLRILDPMLSYPSIILGRERAIVLNLEHIKAIITSEEVLLRDPLDDNVIPIIEELQRRLPPVNAICKGQVEDEENHGAKDDVESVEQESPFEFRALEVALEGICSFLDARTRELETAAYPALDELTSKISSRNLDRVRKLKSAMTRLTSRVQKAYFMQIEGTLNKLTTLREYIDDTEDYINIQLDNHRNQLIQLELFLSSGTVCLSIYSLVAAIFGMNIPYTWKEGHGYVFKWVVILAGLLCGSIFLSIVTYARHKGLVGS
ncbi:magnesium transporter MRS2-I-like isoform X12 [Rhododendron vialii]|uniref:magnesium transporter MRS2-I-like isoform X12 n=1 Tax=Rhododendron vialii TaxID=182163 RepID=UPI00265F7A85|nr:magnesium transporter MRS2-I-like isoform X12 [Rhododendron vialii]